MQQAGPSWYIDETYVKVAGKWCYLYRAIDRVGNLIDCRLSKKRDLKAAKAFLLQAIISTGQIPDRATTDKHASFPKAIEEVFDGRVLHRTNNYLNNLIEQDHRGIKSRYDPVKGFKSFESAARFCPAFDELRHFYRPQSTRNQKVSLAERRSIYLDRTKEFSAMFSDCTF
jgi:putative transposase